VWNSSAPSLPGDVAARARAFYRHHRTFAVEAGCPAYELLVRIPLVTASSEDLVFRSGLESILRMRRSESQAMLLSAALFGGWHILPTLNRVHNSLAMVGVRSSFAQKTLVLAGNCAVTAASGLAFSWLRNRTGSVLTPMVVHCAVNAGGLAGGRILLALENTRSLPVS
jgi:membrane protease YdiL (CAAX protease family)